MEFTGATYPLQRGLSGAFFAWLWTWLRYGGADSATAYQDETIARQYEAIWNYPLSRHQRRMMGVYDKIPTCRKRTAFDRVVSRGLTPTRRLERYANIGLLGRVPTYGIWGKWRARVICQFLTGFMAAKAPDGAEHSLHVRRARAP